MAALIDIVKKGSTDRSVTIRIIDSTDGTPETGVVYNTSGIDLWYRREGATKASITEADLSTPALDDAHADGGFLHVSDGEYRLDLPDAAFATGANHVDVGGTVTGMVVIGGRGRLVNWDPEDDDGTSLTEAGGTGDHLTALATASAMTTVDTVVDAIKAVTDNLPDSGALTTITNNIAAILTDTGTTLDGKLDTIAAYLDTEIAAILEDTGTTLPALIGTPADTDIATDIANLVAQLFSDANAEPTGVPSATATLAVKIATLFMIARNQVDITATKKTFYDDAGNPEFEKDLSDDGTTYSESEANAI